MAFFFKAFFFFGSVLQEDRQSKMNDLCSVTNTSKLLDNVFYDRLIQTKGMQFYAPYSTPCKHLVHFVWNQDNLADWQNRKEISEFRLFVLGRTTNDRSKSQGFFCTRDHGIEIDSYLSKDTTQEQRAWGMTDIGFRIGPRNKNTSTVSVVSVVHRKNWSSMRIGQNVQSHRQAKRFLFSYAVFPAISLLLFVPNVSPSWDNKSEPLDVWIRWDM